MFGLWSHSAGKTKELVAELQDQGKLAVPAPEKPNDRVGEASQPSTDEPASQASTATTVDESSESEATDAPASVEVTSPAAPDPVADAPVPKPAVTPDAPKSPPPKPRNPKRFSWRNLLVQPRGGKEHHHMVSTEEEHVREEHARQDYQERKILETRSEKRAKQSALVVRELIIGPFAIPAASPARSTAAVSSVSATKVKAQLLQPKTAKKVIAQLRVLPSSDSPVVVGKDAHGEAITSVSKGPIHAVCLADTDSDAYAKHFCKLDHVHAPPPPATPQIKSRSMADLTALPGKALGGIASVTSSSVDQLRAALSDLRVVSLITVPELGIGNPPDGPGILSGAVPTASAVINGLEQLTPQIMALGYATGQAILPSHAGVYPPTDRMSVLTYWWGLEVVMPPASIEYLSHVPSVAHSVINFLTAISVVHNGVREIMPFVRYISQYIDAEFNSIKSQDQGQGVVCAATWLMPAALVPRPWDFPAAPASPEPSPGPGSAVPPVTIVIPTASSASSNPSSALLTPPLPEPNTMPVFVDASKQGPGVPADDFVGVTVTPPTPPASETLGKAKGQNFGASVTAPNDTTAAPVATVVSEA